MALSTRAKWGIGLGVGVGIVLAAAAAGAGPARDYTRSPGPPKPGKADPSQVTTQLQPTPAFDVRDPNRAWASAYTAKNLAEALTRAAERGARTRVLDISKQGGGPFEPHKSHQEGRDVDLGMPSEALIDLRRLLGELLNQVDGDAKVAVTAIFLDEQIQRRLYAADPKGIASEALQYPDRKKTKTTRVWHWPGHADHLHVRFRA